MNITVYGGGSWGTALAHVLAYSGRKVCLLLRDKDIAVSINKKRENSRYLPGLILHPNVKASTDRGILAESDIWVLAVPCQNQRQTLTEAASLLRPDTIVINASKGIELCSLMPMSEVTDEALGTPENFVRRYAVLSGPSFAKEVMEGKPTAVVLGCMDDKLGARLRELFAAPWFRSYSSRDVRGVEIGGAIKNVIAIAAGVCDGLNFGHNARAGLITRGLAEISRLGTAMGAQPATFMGLSGLGDLLLTCTGDLSRNRQVGRRLAQGETTERIIASMGMVAEGVKTTVAVHSLAARHNVEMPITAAMSGVIAGSLAPKAAVSSLMSRALKAENQEQGEH